MTLPISAVQSSNDSLSIGLAYIIPHYGPPPRNQSCCNTGHKQTMTHLTFPSRSFSGVQCVRYFSSPLKTADRFVRKCNAREIGRPALSATSILCFQSLLSRESIFCRRNLKVLTPLTCWVVVRTLSTPDDEKWTSMVGYLATRYCRSIHVSRYRGG